MSFPFQSDLIKGTITYKSIDEVTVQGNIDDTIQRGRIIYKAANPCDRRSSFSGSGLPFSSYHQAFEKSPNMGEIELQSNNTFKIDILTPNSYYISLGTVLVCPTLFIEYSNGQMNKTIPIKINNSIPFRSLTYPISKKHISRESPMFYDGMHKLPVRSQAQILFDSAYKMSGDNHIYTKIPQNFWGLKPPV